MLLFLSPANAMMDECIANEREQGHLTDNLSMRECSDSGGHFYFSLPVH